MPGVDDNIGAVFAALADPTRRQVVRSLSRQPDLTASRLAGELPMTRQAVTKHLVALDRAGLVSARREGRETRYTLTPAPLADAMRWMDDVGAEWDARLAKLAERRCWPAPRSSPGPQAGSAAPSPSGCSPTGSTCCPSTSRPTACPAPASPPT